MAVNSSSSGDFLLFNINCSFIRPSSFIFMTYYITYILLLLPLCILILYLGLQRWRQQRSTSTAALTSHSDSFTYHMVTMELAGVLGSILSCCGIIRENVNIFFWGFFLRSVPWYGEMFFHILTCAERYLAVVHPVTYLSLRRERGIRIRNISIGCTWLLCFGAIGLMASVKFFFADFCLSIFFFITVVFYSLSVLRVLIRPGPGEQGGDRERADQSKRRAFYTIVAILGVLVLRFFTSLFLAVVHILRQNQCVATMTEVWLSIPSSLVLPVLFLHRAGTLACCKNNTQ